MKTIVYTVRWCVLFCLLILQTGQMRAQSLIWGDGKFEAGLALGPMIFLGDLGGNEGKGKTFLKDVDLPLTKFTKGFFVNVYPGEWFGLRFAANLGQVEADDAEAPNNGGHDYFRRKRNLKFKSSMADAYLAAEIYPTVLLEQLAGLEHKLRPYGLAGVGVFRFNPKGEYLKPGGGSEWVKLRPLGLEGQGMAEYPDRKPYSLTQFALIMGVGFKFYVTERAFIGMEVVHRKTFTDYIDDVSTTYIDPSLFNNYLDPALVPVAQQLMFRENLFNPNVNRRVANEQRGDPKENDAYFTAMLRLGWRLNGANSPNGRARRQLRCPSFY